MRTGRLAARSVLVLALVATFRPTQASDLDRRIESDAQTSFVFRAFLRGDVVSVQAREGMVLLAGTVAGEQNRSLAQELAARLPGVAGVDNRLELAVRSPAADSDAQLLDKVRTSLALHRTLSAVPVEIRIVGGIVTLHGEVPSPAHMDTMTEYVREVEGVRGLNNTLTLPPPSEHPGYMPSVNANADSGPETAGTIDDPSISAMVAITLLNHRVTCTIKTTVSTEAGVVTVSGKVRNPLMKELVANYAADVHGVRGVVNNMYYFRH